MNIRLVQHLEWVYLIVAAAPIWTTADVPLDDDPEIWHSLVAVLADVTSDVEAAAGFWPPDGVDLDVLDDVRLDPAVVIGDDVSHGGQAEDDVGLGQFDVTSVYRRCGRRQSSCELKQRGIWQYK